jgi:hypothetical protein
MRWKKLGLIFSPDGQFLWMQSHASLPVSFQLHDGIYRVYFASRDSKNRSHIGYMEFDIKNVKNALYISNQPVLIPGPIGCFDDHGVYASSLVEHEAKIFMYYIGWNPGVKAPLFYSSIGLAISEDRGRTFKKVSPAPIISRSQFDPCLVTSPCVLLDGGVWRMWYVSGFKWERDGDELHSYYHIKYAESKDGIRWERKGLICIDLLPGERNIARPCVLKEDIYKMWYSCNSGQGYRIGYAESSDGCVWKRMDNEAGIDVSPVGWDSKAIAYPWVFIHSGGKYMLYNGNDFGKDGFGLALED